MGVPQRLFRELNRALDAVQRELRLLEADLGLCPDCGERPPIPFSQRARHTAPRASSSLEHRRVA
ncbi:MAG TPA: hypothetical protein VII06_29535 [Chloroflexota bacterium]|jgi:hypothetical protein